MILALVGCTTETGDVSPPPTVTAVSWTQDGTQTALPDAEIRVFGTASSDDASCATTTRIELMPRDVSYTIVIDLAEYASGTEVLSPAPPFDERPPTFLLFEGGSIYLWSGGPATFEVDAAADEHVLRLDAPSGCPGHWRDVDVAECVVGSPITLSFSGILEAVESCAPGFAGTETTIEGTPYCVGEEWASCGST